MLPISNFVYGEVSPNLEGREDIPSYFSGCRKMRNFYPLVHGAARRRPGTLYVNAAKYPDKLVRLIPFVFSVNQAYVLEFGDKYMRIHYDSGTLMNGSVPYEIATNYLQEDLEGLNYCQSADVMFIVHPKHRPCKLSRYGELDWRMEPMIFTNLLVLPPPSLLMIKDTTATPPPDPDKIDREYAVTLMDRSGRETAVSPPASVSSPYVLDYMQKVRVSLAFNSNDSLSGEAMQQFHTRSGGWGSFLAFRHEDFEGYAGIDGSIFVSSVNFIASNTGGTTSATFTMFDKQGGTIKSGGVQPSQWRWNGREYYCNLTINERIFIGDPTETTPSFRLRVDGSINTPEGGQYKTIINYSLSYGETPTNDAEMEYMMVYRKVNGMWAYVGRSKWEGEGTVFDDDGTYAPDITRNPPVYKNSFNSEGDYPCTVAFDSQRLIFGGTLNKPSTIWGSMTGRYDNFAVYETQTATSPYEYTLASRQINAIRWMVPSNKLLIGTAGSEWALSGDDGGAVTAVSVFAKSQTAVGGSGLAIAQGPGALFINRTGQEVRTMNYSYSHGGYDSASLSLFAEHLTRRRRIKSWAWAENPHNIAWCVCDDGIMLALTYNQQHEVVAWSYHETDGFFENVAVIPAEDADEVWFVVRREVNGQTVRYVEMMMPEFKTDIREAFFVDCGLSYHGEPVDRIEGLSHLEGKTVQILADGAAHLPRLVENGAVELDIEASMIHIGLGFSSRLETHNLARLETGESISSRKRRLDNVSVRFEDSLGGAST